MSSNRTDNRYMEFKIGDKSYAVPLLQVKEVIRLPEITPVPDMPAHFSGMMNLRGQILAVFNVRKKLNSKPKENAQHTDVVMVVEDQNVCVGMIVDEVTQVIHVTEDMHKAAPLKKDDPSAAYVNSVIQTKKDLVLSLNLAMLLELNKYQKNTTAAA